MFRISSIGDYKNTEDFLLAIVRQDIFSRLESYGQLGVILLAQATPVDSGITSNSWTYEVTRGKNPTITWSNTHMAGGTPLAVMIQYGHGTGTGGWVEGRDFINPAMRPLFDKIAEDVWRAVTSA